MMYSWSLTTRLSVLALLIAATPAMADDCNPPLQDNGRVAAVIDARTLRLDDGREVRLAGLAPLDTNQSPLATALLQSLVAGRNIVVHSSGDGPDRYGRQSGWLRLDADGPSVQAMLAAQGGALAQSNPADAACGNDVREAETDARRGRLGIWAGGSAIKNAESPGDILAGIGRYAIVEGRVLSVRQAGSVTYVNFGRRWTRDFTVTMPGRVLPSFEAAGMTPNALTGKRLRVRGFIERRGGPNGSPRIEATRPGQIEIVGAGDVAGTSE